MPTRKNHLKKYTKKTSLFRRKNNKKKTRKTNNKRKHKKSHKKAYKKQHYKKTKRSKNKMIVGGGEWLTDEELPEYNKDDICVLCQEKFSETPDKAIYKTDCNHNFHNNCLNDYCVDYIKRYKTDENPYPEAICPICKKDLGYDAMDVYAFAEKSLDTKLNPNVKKIYDAQENNPPNRIEARRIEDDEDEE
jgi:hypothetical protein